MIYFFKFCVFLISGKLKKHFNDMSLVFDLTSRWLHVLFFVF